MKATLEEIVLSVLNTARVEGVIKSEAMPPIIIDRPKREEHGDFSTNVAMLMASSEGRKPRDIAEDILSHLGAHEMIEKCEVAGPGFINFFLKESFWHKRLAYIIKAASEFGRVEAGKGKKVQVEFVSANPTGPLHIGHGRGAAVGASLSAILTAAGFDVTREYYINDIGSQMDTLGRSLYHRYNELLGDGIEFPENHYQGDYMKDIARDFITKHGEKYRDASVEDLPKVFTMFARSTILSGIKEDLKDFNVDFDVWTSEASIVERGLVEETIEALRGKGVIYEKDGALWFRTTDFGDDKDRVLIKADGKRTYFASDVAYHMEKLRRGFDKVIDIWGADHHGYQGRIRALFKAFGEDDKRLDIIFIQLVSLLRNGEPVSMSTRGGEFVTLKEVVDEVGKDACRFTFMMRRSDAQLDFDLELVKIQAPENPVYYVQYCHARIMSILTLAKEKGFELSDNADESIVERLKESDEIKLIKKLAAFEEVVEKSAIEMEPHRIAFYLQELAAIFHSFYGRNRVVLDDDKDLTFARMGLSKAVSVVIKNGLAMLGVSAPDKM